MVAQEIPEAERSGGSVWHIRRQDRRQKAVGRGSTWVRYSTGKLQVQQVEAVRLGLSAACVGCCVPCACLSAPTPDPASPDATVHETQSIGMARLGKVNEGSHWRTGCQVNRYRYVQYMYRQTRLQAV